MDNRKSKLQEIATANGHAVFGEEGLNLILEVFKLMTYGKDIEDTVTKVNAMLLGKKKKMTNLKLKNKIQEITE